MDNFWEEQSKLTEEEIKENYNGKIADALLAEKDHNGRANRNTSKVMRLNKKEEKLINLIRQIGIEPITSELQQAASTFSDFINLKKVINVLEDKPDLELYELVENGVLTEKQADTLKKYIDDNNNIIITGIAGSGKTTLLRTLLRHNVDIRTLVVERINEIDINEVLIDTNKCNWKSIDEVSIKDFTNLKQSERTRVLIGELYDYNSMYSLITALNMGSSIMTSTQLYFNNNLKDRLLSLVDNDLRDTASEVLNKHKFIQVVIEDRIVKDIKEIVLY